MHRARVPRADRVAAEREELVALKNAHPFPARSTQDNHGN